MPDAAPAGGGGNLPTVSNEVNVELSVTNELVSGSGERSAKSELEKEISVVEQPAGTGSTGAAEGSDAGASTGTPDNAGEKEPGAGEEEAPKPETEDAGASSTE